LTDSRHFSIFSFISGQHFFFFVFSSHFIRAVAALPPPRHEPLHIDYADFQMLTAFYLASQLLPFIEISELH
jgi:hypothetical protein